MYGICKPQTWGDLNITKSSLFMLHSRTRELQTSNLAEITELLSGTDRTQATQSRSRVSSLGGILTFPDNRLRLSENGGFLVFTCRGLSEGLKNLSL